MLLQSIERWYASQQHGQQHASAGIISSGVAVQPELLDERREDQRRHGLADRAARDVSRHGHAALRSRESVHERGGRRMECRAAETAEHEHQRQRDRIGRESDQRDRRDAETGPASRSRRGRHRSAMWPNPSWATEFASWKNICNMPSGCQRQIQVEDEQRQQRREDVAEAVDDEMGARQHHDRGMEPEQTEFHRDRRLSRRVTSARPSLNSRMRSSHEAAPSTTSDKPMVIGKTNDLHQQCPAGPSRLEHPIQQRGDEPHRTGCGVRCARTR